MKVLNLLLTTMAYCMMLGSLIQHNGAMSIGAGLAIIGICIFNRGEWQ